MRILWARHGTSGANVIAALELLYRTCPGDQRKRVLDMLHMYHVAWSRQHGLLTRLGRLRSLQAGTALREHGPRVSMVVSSCMPRALETAHLMAHECGLSHVYVFPYLQELGNPAASRAQVERFARESQIRVCTRYYNTTNNSSSSSPQAHPDLSAFRALLRTLPVELTRCVLVVTHGNLLQRGFPGTVLFHNNEIREMGPVSHVWHQPQPGPRLGGVDGIERMMRTGLLDTPGLGPR